MNIKMEEAMNLVKSKRDCINPNNGFRKYLKIYEYHLGIINEDEFLKEIKIVVPTLKKLNNPKYFENLLKKKK
jgi:hypothetical protein